MRRTTSGRPLLAGVAGLLALALCVPTAVADPGSGNDSETPTKAEVEAAKDAASNMERTVSAVQADLVMANQRLQEASVLAAQASEAYNAARWKLGEAQKAAKAADRRADSAAQQLEVQADAYNEMVAATYEMNPKVTAMATIAGEDGTDTVLDNSNTLFNMNTSMDDITASYDAARTVANLASDRAETAHDDAAQLAEEAETARQNAESQEQAALSQATTVAAQKDELIAELADLQDISVSLASKRQTALEQAAQERAARAAQAAQAEEEPTTPTNVPADDPEPTNDPGTGDDPTPSPDPEPAPDPTPAPDPQPDPKPDPAPQPDPTPPPSSSGAQRAINFARAQIGEPYVWAAAGPNSWDCSGLTMKAWQSGGKYLPHYSVGQYSTSTAIRSSQLKPGDLVFWGSSSSPSSIYHVALYVGNGQMIHAPRTGRNVTQESMYYWIPPNFFARP